MAQQTISIGTTAGDGTGTSLRAAGSIINGNFTQLFAKRYNVRDYGAVGDWNGTTGTNDTAAFAAVIAAMGVGDQIFVPTGNYLVDMNVIAMKQYTRLTGQGRGSKIFARGTGGVGQWMVDISGTNENVRNSGVTIDHIHLDGNNIARGVAIRSYYGSEIHIHNMSCWYWPDGFLYAVGMWDSRIRDCQLDWPCWNSGWAIWFKNSDAVSGFGYATTNTNQIHMSGLRLETLVHGGIRIEAGTNNTNSPNTIYVYDTKIESYSWTTEGAIWIGDNTKNCSFRDIYLAFGNWSSGTTAIDAITVGATAGGIVFDTVNIYQEISGILARCFKLTNAARPDYYRQIIYGGVNNNPTVAVIDVVSGMMPIIDHIDLGGATGVTATAGLTGFVLTDAATIAIPAHYMYPVYRVTLSGNRTLGAPTGLVAGQKFSVYIRQDGTGSRTLAYNAAWKFSGGTPILTTAANALDVLEATYDGTTLIGRLIKGYA